MARQAWEYLVAAEPQLPELGRRGWELVAVLPGEHGAARCYLKRPAPTFRERVTGEQKRRYYASRGLAPGDEAAR